MTKKRYIHKRFTIYSKWDVWETRRSLFDKNGNEIMPERIEKHSYRAGYRKDGIFKLDPDTSKVVTLITRETHLGTKLPVRENTFRVTFSSKENRKFPIAIGRG